MVGHRIGFFATLIAIFSIVGAAARAEPRLALVIGNSNYRDVVALPNPAKDADAMDGFLRKAGFDVTPANNLTQSEMRRELRDFADKVSAAGPDAVALVYYAGHGVQIDGENYLIPVDARIKREADVPIAAVRLDDVMNILSTVPAKTRIVILDACRNNPFSAIDKTIGRGLAIVDAPKGSIVSYSTAPGATALDGSGDHSPFTTALLSVASMPGLPVEQTFKKVRLEVNKETDGRQTPWESSSLISNFEFFPEHNAPKSSEAPQQVAARDETTQHEAVQHETRTVAVWRQKLSEVTPEQGYDMVIEANTVEAYEAFLTVYPKFEYVVRIRTLVDRRLEMIAWYDATTLNDVLAYESFLVHYPDSDLAATAKRLLARAKNRSLSPDMLANASAGPAAGAAATKVITKVVEKPVVVTKVVEKPVVKVVREVVHVPSGPCECTDCGRRAGRRPPVIEGGGRRGYHPIRPPVGRYPVSHPIEGESGGGGQTIMVRHQQSFARFSGGMHGRR
jgi:Caspase domain